MRGYCVEKMLDDMCFKAPPPDPIADRIEEALAAGLTNEAHTAIEALDDLADDPDLEPEESDGGDRDERNYGLSVNETIYIHRECPCCGKVHSCEELFVS